MRSVGPCPDCRLPLAPRGAGSLTVHRCASCAGLFLPVGMLEAAREDASVRARVREPGPPAAPGATGAPPAERLCPVCRAPMARRRKGAFPQLIIEVCRRHGAFLDRGELTRLVEVLEAERGAPSRGAGAGVAATTLALSASPDRPLGERLAEAAEAVLDVGGTAVDVAELIAAIFD